MSNKVLPTYDNPSNKLFMGKKSSFNAPVDPEVVILQQMNLG